ncbi:MAG: NAD(P)H-hydrate epimerase [Anaerolineae bacterium]|nr:NAD(P)H-hydrate epimerase [Anaerolineae bacterium]
MDFPRVRGVPYLTTEQMREVDRAMIEDYGIQLIQMMENAGRALATLARARFLEGNPRQLRVVVLAGTGGNGGGALVCARHLHNYGADVLVVVTKEDDAFAPVPGHQLAILRRMQVPVIRAETLVQTRPPNGNPAAGSGAGHGPGGPLALIVDGIIGYSLQGAPRGAAADLIRWANCQGAPTLALDAPSGVDTTSGTVFDPAIRAAATMTLALPKAGLRATGVAEFTGELYLADISVPPALYAGPGLGLHVGPIFAESGIVRLS